MKELVVISGKGGTGKTSITASLAVLAAAEERPVVADCDVDAADLHLILQPVIRQKQEFRSGRCARIVAQTCMGCGRCEELCRFSAICKTADGKTREVNASACEGCKVCVQFCPANAITFEERLCGEWMISGTRLGTLVHAKLHAGGENSGKLVTCVRNAAKQEAENNGACLIVTDGPPGIGCPVIASVTGASLVLVVTEPTVSGEHDLKRVLQLTKHFKIPAVICVNKWDLNPQMTERIEAFGRTQGASAVGRVRYDRDVTAAQLAGKAVVETCAKSGADIQALWEGLRRRIPSAT